MACARVIRTQGKPLARASALCKETFNGVPALLVSNTAVPSLSAAFISNLDKQNSAAPRVAFSGTLMKLAAHTGAGGAPPGAGVLLQPSCY